MFDIYNTPQTYLNANAAGLIAFLFILVMCSDAYMKYRSKRVQIPFSIFVAGIFVFTVYYCVLIWT